MLSLPHYSYVSLGGTATRVLSAIKNGKNAEQVVQEALDFPRSWFMDKVVNKVMTFLGREDYYARQNQSKAEFALALIRFCNGAKKSDGQIEQAFSMTDASGVSRRCLLSGDASGMALLELELVYESSFADCLPVTDVRLNDLQYRVDSDGYNDFRTESRKEIMSFNQADWLKLRSDAKQLQDEIDQIETDLSVGGSNQIGDTSQSALMWTVVTHHIVNKIPNNRQTYSHLELKAAEYIAGEIASSDTAAAPPQNFYHVVEQMIKNADQHDPKSVTHLALKMLEHAATLNKNLIADCVVLIVANQEHFHGEDRRKFATYLSDYSGDVTRPEEQRFVGALVAFIVTNPNPFDEKKLELAAKYMHIMLDSDKSELFAPTSVQVVAFQVMASRVIAESSGNEDNKFLIRSACRYIFKAIKDDLPPRRLLSVVDDAASYVLENHTHFDDGIKQAALKYKIPYLRKYSDQIIDNFIQFDKNQVILQRFKDSIIDYSDAFEDKCKDLKDKNKALKDKDAVRQAIMYLVKKQGQGFTSDEIKKAMELIARYLSDYADNITKQIQQFDTDKIVVNKIKQIISKNDTSDKKLLQKAVSNIVLNHEQFEASEINKAIEQVKSNFWKYSVTVIDKALWNDKSNRIVSEIQRLFSAGVDNGQYKRSIHTLALVVVNNQEKFTAEEVNQAVEHLKFNVHRYPEKVIQQLGKDHKTANKVDVVEAIEEGMEKVIADVDNHDPELVGFVAAYIIQNSGFEDVSINNALIYIASHWNSFSGKVRALTIKALTKPQADASLRKASYEVAMNSIEEFRGIYKEAINHIAENLTSYSEQTIKLALKSDVNLVIAKKIREILSGDVSASEKLRRFAAVCMMKNPDSFSDKERKDAATYIGGLVHDVSIDRALHRLAVSDVMDMHDKFDTADIDAALEAVANDFDHYSSRTIACAAQHVIRKNRTFFEAPVNRSSLRLSNEMSGQVLKGKFVNQEKFVAFYEERQQVVTNREKFIALYKNQQQEQLIMDYASGLAEILEESLDRISVKTERQFNNQKLMRRFYWTGAVDKARDDSVSGHVVNESGVFYEEEKTANSPDDTKGNLVSTLLAQGDFGAAVHADENLARYIIKKRADPAIEFFNTHNITSVRDEVEVLRPQ